MVRGNLIETMNEDYIRTARAKGTVGAPGHLQARPAREPHAGRDDVRARPRGAARAARSSPRRCSTSPASARCACRPIGTQDFPEVMGVTIFAALFIAIANLVVDVVVRLPRPEGEVHARVAEPLLEVKDLKVHFPTDDGVVKAVDGVSSRVQPGETLGDRGGVRLGQERDVPHRHGPDRLEGRGQIDGEVIFQGQDLLEACPTRCASIRGAKISDDLPGPHDVAAPVLQGGRPDRRGASARTRTSPRRRRWTRRSRCCGKVGIPKPGGARQAVPARVLRRHAPAGDDRDGARAEPGPV